MRVVKRIAVNVVNYVIAALQTYHVLPASAINLYQRNVFSQIAGALPDFMIAIQHKQTARVIILYKNSLIKYIIHS